VALLASGCAHNPANAPLTAIDPRKGYRFETALSQTNSDELFLAVDFSGRTLKLPP